MKKKTQKRKMAKESIINESMVQVYRNKLIKLLDQGKVISLSGGYSIYIRDEFTFDVVDGNSGGKVVTLLVGGEEYDVAPNKDKEKDVYNKAVDVIERYRDDVVHKGLGHVDL